MKGTTISNFREKVLEQKEKVTEKEFFTSEACGEYLQNLAEAINKKYNNDISLSIEWGNPNDYIAFATDRFSLKINVNNCFFNSAQTKVDKLVILKALVLHECGHLLFTDFHLKKNALKVMFEKRILFPAPSCEEYSEWQTDMITITDIEMKRWIEVWRQLENSIEDGFIEQMVLNTVPGEGQCLYPLRNMQKEEFESIKVQKNNGLSTSSILFNSILSLAKYNTIKMDPDDKDEPAIKALLDNYDLIMNAVSEQKSFNRMKLVNTLFCKIYKFLKEEQNEEKSSNKKRNETENHNSDSTTNNASDENETDSKQKSDKSSDGNNDETDTTNDSEEISDENNNDSQSSNNPDATQSDSRQSNSNDSQQNSNTDNNNNTDDNLSNIPSPEDILNNMPDTCMNDNIDTNSGSVLNDNNITQKNEQNNNAVNESVKEKLDRIMSNDEIQSEIPSPEDERQTDYINETIAESIVKDAEEKKLAEELKAEAQNMDYGDINRNTNCVLKRNAPTPNAYKIYENDMKDISFLVKKLVKEIKDKIKDQQQGGKLNGLYQGRYLDQHSLYRYDLRMLCKNDLPEDIPDMAIGILIDNSGSMAQGRKIDNARKTALLLYEFGLQLNIPVMVYGHSSYKNVTLNALADFGSVDNKDRFRICDMTACGCNRDGMALRFCSEKLSQRHEQNKIMFMISDGLPSDYGSYEDAANDIRNVLMDYGKKGIKYITVGLGSDQKRIEELYCNHLSSRSNAKFLNTDDASDIPVLTVRIIKELIKSR